MAVAFRYPARRVEIETRVLPALKKLHAFGGNRLAFEHHLERALPEELLERVGRDPGEGCGTCPRGRRRQVKKRHGDGREDLMDLE